MEYIPIDKAAVPYVFDIDIGGKSFTFDVNYNGRFDFFTLDLSDSSGRVITQGEKIVYGQPLFSSVSDPALPSDPIMPLDFSGQETRVGYAQLGETVFLILGVSAV